MDWQYYTLLVAGRSRTGIRLMDSVGLGMLVALDASLTPRQVRLVLSDVDGTVKSLVMITKLDRVLELYDTEDEALADF